LRPQRRSFRCPRTLAFEAVTTHRTMDFVDDELSSEFVFRNPKSKGACGCGESFNV
jgi:Fe-S cluster assembly iron-binding protein IscA